MYYKRKMEEVITRYAFYNIIIHAYLYLFIVKLHMLYIYETKLSLHFNKHYPIKPPIFTEYFFQYNNEILFITKDTIFFLGPSKLL